MLLALDGQQVTCRFGDAYCRYGGHSHGAEQKRGTLLTMAGFLFLYAGCALQALIGKWA